MKRFLAGLALALVAAVILQSRKKAEEGNGLPTQDGRGGKRESSPGRESVIPQPGSNGGETNVRARTITAQSRDAAADRQQAPLTAAIRSEAELLNSATRQQLLSVYGIGPVLADRIIQHRPYAAAHDVVQQGIIPESTFAQLKKQLLEQANVRDTLTP